MTDEERIEKEVKEVFEILNSNCLDLREGRYYHNEVVGRALRRIQEIELEDYKRRLKDLEASLFA